MENIGQLKTKLERIANQLPEKALSIIEVEGLNFISENFQNEGFKDQGLEKWKPRKTTDRQGRDLTRYRSNRKGTIGSLTKFGRENEGRAILTGHNTGGNKLRNSFRARREKLAVVFFTYKKYAQYHNEGTRKLPKRQFIGKSTYLEGKIQEKIKNTLDKTLKN